MKDDLLIMMRTYLEKPRTAKGWRGLVSDPDLTGREDMARGLALGRRVLLDILAAGLPTATEFLDPLVTSLSLYSLWQVEQQPSLSYT